MDVEKLQGLQPSETAGTLVAKTVCWDSLSAKWIEGKANEKILHLVDGMYLAVLNQLIWVVDATATDAAFEIVIELVSGMSILIQQSVLR